MTHKLWVHLMTFLGSPNAANYGFNYGFT